jgi:hypothetical protein
VALSSLFCQTINCGPHTTEALKRKRRPRKRAAVGRRSSVNVAGAPPRRQDFPDPEVNARHMPNSGQACTKLTASRCCPEEQTGNNNDNSRSTSHTDRPCSAARRSSGKSGTGVKHFPTHGMHASVHQSASRKLPSNVALGHTAVAAGWIRHLHQKRGEKRAGEEGGRPRAEVKDCRSGHFLNSPQVALGDI